jgi:hypothetical protein
MSASRGDDSYFARLFRPRKKSEFEEQSEAIQTRPVSARRGKRIVCFRIDGDLDRRLTRALMGKACSRSDFIRTAIERILKQDAEERLRVAHSAIRWE